MTKEVITINSPIKEFEELKNFKPKEKFNGCIIIPTRETHDSGFICMKFALTQNNKVVGCVGGGSDVVHINGIGGYGKYGKDFETAIISQKVARVSWSIDCLPNGLLRLFSDHWLSIDDIICSDFALYAGYDRVVSALSKRKGSGRMAKAPTMDEWAEKIGTIALNGFVYEGRTLREWIDLMASGYCVVLPDGATNGDVVRMIFPNIEQDKERLRQKYGSQALYDTYEKWCELPYKVGDIDG